MTKHEIIVQWIKVSLGIIAIVAFYGLIRDIKDIKQHVKNLDTTHILSEGTKQCSI